MTILMICAAVAVAAVALLWLGLRGRRVGDHPFCRKCGFDLFGRPQGSQVCPECGSELAGARATIIGVRQRRRGPLFGGVVLLVPALAVGGVIGWGRANQIDWQKHKPSWWLARETRSTIAATRDAALDELIVRLNANQLSKERIHALTQRGLQHQAATAEPWVWRWGNLIEAAQAAGAVSEADWKKYSEQAVANYHALLVRPKLRRHDELSFEIKTNAARVGRSGRLQLIEVARSVELQGSEMTVGNTMSTGPLRAAPTAWRRSIPMKKELLKHLPYGARQGHVCIDMTIVDFNQLRTPPPAAATTSRAKFPAPPGYHRQRGLDHALIRVPVRIPFTIQIVPADEEILEPITDETLRPKVMAALSASQARLSSVTLTLELRCDDAPVDLAFEVLAVVDGVEHRVGLVAFERGSSRRQMLSGALPWRPNRPRVDTIDIIFRPDTAAAVSQLNINSYWKHEIVLEDLEVDDLRHHTAAEIDARRRGARTK